MKYIHYSGKYPIIVIPGLFGSWGEGIIRDNNTLGFGPSRDIYSPLLEFLIENGYELNKNLFISFYNWRLDNDISAKKYLIPMINKAKAITNMNKVILICHSMGGLVARTYIQGDKYKNDVDTLIMLGTPNSGASISYLFWEGGEVYYEKLHNNFLFKTFWNSYLWYLKKIYKENGMKPLQGSFPSIKQLLPTKLFYGDYIYKKDRYGRKRYIDIGNMKEQNYFLEKLNREVYKLKYRVANIHQIIGYGFLTNDSIEVKRNNSDKWIDGKPVKINETINGDGTVIVDSSQLPHIDKHYLKKDHSDLVKYSTKILKDILNLKYDKKILKYDKKYISLLFKNINDMSIKIDNVKIKINEIYKYDYVSSTVLDKNTLWIIIKIKDIRDIELEIEPKKHRKAEFVAISDEELLGGYNLIEEKLYKKTKLKLI
ncbi:hypothetical protein GOQ29_13290 [Clostridium sp. D2Q-14]|uniref:esterase/lipase family protein n=1 Tax=Anaeromonas gelatinilytica TaxID=2683194 RepID=UPI00193B9DD5|nr:hypothetical protein [Anaeromonas gelatinilytica]MBS4536593.1 hypothetical protein [Anaeromonas gelatinilytica]